MNVTLNGYLINDPSSSVFLDEPIDGLGIPPIRTSMGNYSGRNGGYIGGQFYAARDITLQGNIFSSSAATLESAASAFQAAIDSMVGGAQVPLQILTNAGNSYIIFCNVIDFQMQIMRNIFSRPFKLELSAPDPIIYDNATGTALTANLPKLVSGGYVYPVVYPVIYSGGGSPTTINNSGTAFVYPIITLTGIMTNPVLTNITTGSVFSLSGLITGSGDVVAIDMRQRTVTLNGSSIFGSVAALSTFWGLKPGNNSITLTTPSGGDTVAGVLSWRAGYKAI